MDWADRISWLEFTICITLLIVKDGIEDGQTGSTSCILNQAGWQTKIEAPISLPGMADFIIASSYEALYSSSL
jgi:hypothetical protein